MPARNPVRAMIANPKTERQSLRWVMVVITDDGPVEVVVPINSLASAKALFATMRDAMEDMLVQAAQVWPSEVPQ
jgi:hypothetical protein